LPELGVVFAVSLAAGSARHTAIQGAGRRAALAFAMTKPSLSRTISGVPGIDASCFQAASAVLSYY
jgi:hypothetical protein